MGEVNSVGAQPEILSIEARDIHVTMRVSVSTIRSIIKCLDDAVIHLDLDVPDNKRALEDMKNFEAFLISTNTMISEDKGPDYGGSK